MLDTQIPCIDDAEFDSDVDEDSPDPLKNVVGWEKPKATRDLSSELLSVLPGQEYSIQDQTLRLNFHDKVTVDIWVDAAPGCGGIVWPAAQILSSYIINSESMFGKTVLELGSGTGLVGIVAAMLGAKTWITDQAPLLDIMHKNVKLNSSSCNVAELNWGEPIPANVPSKPDMILAADCVYFEPAFPLLVQTLGDLADTNTKILFCYKKRRKADKRFFSMLKKLFSWTEVMDDPNRSIYSREAITLISLHKL